MATVPKSRQRDDFTADASGLNQRFLETAREVLRVRISMLMINELIKKKTFSVPIHLALGHEAIAVAVAATMQPSDRLLLTHRNIHYNLACNPSLRREIDEYLLRESGLAGGRNGAMNLTNPDAGVIYTSSILANCLPVATGIAMGQCVSQRDAVTIALTGDGALEEGAFYETLMIANSLNLPLVVVIENNEWSMHTRIDERRCAVDLESIATAFGMKIYRLTGNDLDLYCDTLRGVRNETSASRKPCVVEVSLSTLGDYSVVEGGSSQSRQINYHTGAVAHLSLANGPIIDESERDPVYMIAKLVPKADIMRWTHEISTELESQLR